LLKAEQHGARTCLKMAGNKAVLRIIMPNSLRSLFLSMYQRGVRRGRCQCICPQFTHSQSDDASK
jgi:hypothetical protein